MCCGNQETIQALEQEVRDLQTEFEADRTDYLETIRRQDQQLRLLGQILEKVQPCIRRDSNYANLELVKAQSVWDQDAQKWRLPELSIQRTKLPPTDEIPDRFSPASTSSSFSSLLKAKQISNRLANGVNLPTDIRTSRSLPTTSTGKFANLSLSSEALNRKPLRLESLNLDEGPQSSSPLRLETLHLSTGRAEPPRRRFAELLDWPA
ncbi:conserved hypothetical protein [Ixodes scapularis]|uniref:Uncharacterized protein n=1 Tax=Ixodes scapularis TaxID=6945 RepID=B7Q062_IXOSC|nr:conserved hypothetical protein [Ixodes scapularis]|eukprot:XP_002406962.1 conserved hypothetical protein [Ixodes scapularis]